VKEFKELTANPNTPRQELVKKTFEIFQSQQAKQILKGSEKSLGKIYNDIVYVGEDSIVSKLINSTKNKLSNFPPEVLDRLTSVRNKASIASGSAPMDLDIGLITGGDKELERALLKKLGGVKGVKEFEEALQKALIESFIEIAAEAGATNINTGKLDITGTTPWNEEAYGQSRVLQGDAPDAEHAQQTADVTKSKIDKEAKAVTNGVKSKESAWQEAARGTLKDRAKMESAFNEIYVQTGKRPGWTSEQQKIWEYLEMIGREGISAEEIRRINAEIKKLTGGKDVFGACKQLADAIESAWKSKPALKLTPGQFIEVLITNKDGTQRRVLIDEQIKMRGEGEADLKAFKTLKDIINRARGNEFINQMLASKTAKNLMNHAVMFAPMALMNMFVQYETGQLNDVHDLAVAMIQVVPFENGFQLMYVGDKSITDKEVLNAFLSEGFFWGLAAYCPTCAPILIAGVVGEMGWTLTKFAADSVRLQNYHSGLVDLIAYNGEFPDGKFEKLVLPDKQVIERWDMRRFLFETKAVKIKIAVPDWGVIINNLSEKTEEVYNKYYLSNDPAMSQLKDASAQLEKNAGCNKDNAEKYCRVYDLIQRQIETRRQEVIDAVMIPHLIRLAEEKHATLNAPEELKDKLDKLQAELETLRGSSLGVTLSEEVSERAEKEAERKELGEEKRLARGEYWQDAYRTYEKIYAIGNNIKENISKKTGYEHAKLLQFKWTGNYVDDLRMATQSKQGFASDIHKITGDIEKAKGSKPDTSDTVDKQAFDILGNVVFPERAVLDELDRETPSKGSTYFTEYKEALQKVYDLYGKNADFQNQLDEGAQIIKEKETLLLNESSGLKLSFTDAAFIKDFENGVIKIRWVSEPSGTFRPDGKSQDVKFTAFRPEPVTITVIVEKSGVDKSKGSLKVVVPVRKENETARDAAGSKSEGDGDNKSAPAAKVQPDSYTKGFGEQGAKDETQEEAEGSAETPKDDKRVKIPGVKDTPEIKTGGKEESGIASDSNEGGETKGVATGKNGIEVVEKVVSGQKTEEKDNKGAEVSVTPPAGGEIGQAEETESGTKPQGATTAGGEQEIKKPTKISQTADPKKAAEEKKRWIDGIPPYLETLIELDKKAHNSAEKAIRKIVVTKAASGGYPACDNECQKRIEEIKKSIGDCGPYVVKQKGKDPMTGEEAFINVIKQDRPCSAADQAKAEEAARLQDPMAHEEFKCYEETTKPFLEHQRDLKNKLGEVNESKAYKNYQEYAAWGLYSDYNKAVDELKSKLSLPEPVPAPVMLPWAYSSSCVSTGLVETAATGKPTKVKSNIKAIIEGLKNRVYYGESQALKVRIEGVPDGASLTSVIWQSSLPGVTFTPPDGAATSVLFGRMGEVKIWAEINVVTDEASDFIETEQKVVAVVAPKFEIDFEPKDGRVGQEIKAVIRAAPDVDKTIIDYRWISPADRSEYETGAIGVFPKNTKPLEIHAVARVPHYGDTIDENIRANFIATGYDIKVTGPKAAGPKPMIWKCDTQLGGSCPGLVEVDKEIAVHQRVEFNAEIAPKPESDLRYNWTVSPNNCTISNPIVKDVGVTCSETGSYQMTVIVRDKDNIELGKGTGNLSVTISQRDIDTAMEKAKPKLILKADKTEINAGEKINIKAEVQGGTPSYSFVWSGGVNPQGASAMFMALKPGKSTVSAEVTDSRQKKDKAEITIEVKLPIFSMRFEPVKASAGQEVRVTVMPEEKIDASHFQIIWISPNPSERREVSADTIGFTPKDIIPYDFLAVVKLKGQKETLAEVNGTFTAEPARTAVQVSASTIPTEKRAPATEPSSTMSKTPAQTSRSYAPTYNPMADPNIKSVKKPVNTAEAEKAGTEFQDGQKWNQPKTTQESQQQASPQSEAYRGAAKKEPEGTKEKEKQTKPSYPPYNTNDERGEKAGTDWSSWAAKGGVSKGTGQAGITSSNPSKTSTNTGTPSSGSRSGSSSGSTGGETNGSGPSSGSGGAPASTSSVTAELTNNAGENIHIFVDGQDNFSPQNRLDSGEKRKISVPVKNRAGVIKFIAGRNGQKLAECRWEYDLDAIAEKVAVVKFSDPKNLSCAVGHR